MKVTCLCLECGASYSVAEESVGRSTRCARCGNTFVLSPNSRNQSSGQNGAGLPAVSQSEVVTSGTVSKAGAGSEDTPYATESWTGDKALSKAPRQIGRFQIRARLGAGGFGAVYRAYDPVLDREVALKVPHRERLLTDQDRARVLREAKAAAQLRHANIVPVHDAGVDGDCFFIASAFIEGRTLAEMLHEGSVGFHDAAKIARDLAGALQHAHDRGIVHRDVKPGNVLLDSSGNVLLTDFGLAHVAESETMLTQEGVVLGTPAYMAPEQARGESNLVGPASDQYSLGVVLYQMLCGRLPFEGPPCAIVARLGHESPPTPRSVHQDVPRKLESICLRAMAKSNLDRYPSCQAMADDLDGWLSGDRRAANGPPLWERLRKWVRHNRKRLAMVASGLALALVLMVSLFQVVIRIRHRDGSDTVVRAPAGSEVEIREDGSVAVTPPLPVSLPDGKDLVGEWHLNEGGGTTARDSSGNGYHGIVRFDQGNPVWRSGYIHFDSPDDNQGCIEVANFPNIEGSMSVVVRLRIAGGFRGLIFPVTKWNPTSSNCSWGMFVSEQKVLDFEGDWPNTHIQNVASNPNVLTPGTWHTVVGRFVSGERLELFLDGKLIASRDVSHTSFRLTGSPLRIGNRHWLGSDWNPFQGDIDYVAIYRGLVEPASHRP